MKHTTHSDRIEAELRAAGMTSYGFIKLETAALPEIIHEDEHIYGVAYGRVHKGIASVMLVATDKRIIHLNCTPFFKNWDEITYEVVAGVNMSVVAPFASIVLHTRVREYEIRFVNMNCARIFTEYIETFIERVGSEMGLSEKLNKKTEDHIQSFKIPQTQKEAATNDPSTDVHVDIAVLSTINSENAPHASVVHFVTDKDDNYYVLTKKETNKIKNIQHDNRVALAIHDEHSLKVTIVHGVAELNKNKAIFQEVYEHIMQIRHYKEGAKLPPIAKINAGEYVVLKIIPKDTILSDYSLNSW